MSFFFDTIALPFWFVLFVFGSASPIWFRWAGKFYKKYIATGAFKKIFRRSRSDEEMIDSIFKKASEHASETSDLFSQPARKPKKRKPQKKHIDAEKKQNMKLVLQLLAESGETGVLAKSVSDKTSINSLETSHALNYLVEKEYAELINGTTGAKYYLTDLGRRYCINKKILSSNA